MPIEFINADLEITSNEDLEPIKMAFANSRSRFAEMYCGETDPGSYLASFEIHPDEERDDQTAEVKILAFCDSVSELRGLARDVWDSATRRVIDLGYQSDNHCEAFNDRVSIDTLRRLEKLGIELALTIYPQEIQSQNTGRLATASPATS
jgi:hypothetical protein